MDIRKLIGFIFLSILLSAEVVAKELTVSLKLVNIRAEKTTELGEDEVYFNITQYSSLGYSNETRIPTYPGHWLSKQLPAVKDLVIWKGVIKENEAVKLIVSLGEEDSLPWDPNDLIGAAQLELENKAGKLQQAWKVPIFEEKEEVEMLKKGKQERFIFKGADSRYDVAFEVECL